MFTKELKSMINSKKVGIDGEKMALEYLKSKAYEILETNWRFSHKEIDIIALIDNYLCIVEVKTRSSDFQAPKEAVNHKKQKNLIQAAHQYVIQHDLDVNVRFDIIEVFIRSKENKLNHIVDAFSAQLDS